MAALAQDDEYQARSAAFDAELEERSRALDEAARPVLDELAAVGLKVEDLWDLYKFPAQLATAVPVLLRHLTLDYPDGVLEGIGQGLAHKASRPWWDDLKAQYVTTQREVVRDRLAAALAECAKREHYDDLLGLLRNRTLGGSRIYFLRPINRIGNRISPGQGRAIIEMLAEDETLGHEATRILKGYGPNAG